MLCSKMIAVILCVVLSVVNDVQSRYEAREENKRRCEANGYTSVSGRFYKIHDESASWDVAQSTCTSEGGYLAVINDGQEAESITKYAFNLVDNIWILVGIRDREENGNWRSVLGDPLDQIYHNWAPSRTSYYCGALKNESSIDDMKCTFEYPFICEKECSLNKVNNLKDNINI